jgi:DNA-binding NtrC family response regulator
MFESEISFASVPMDSSITLAEARQKGVDEIEKIYLKELLTQNNGKIKTSAEVAGISTRQLHKLMKKHGFRKEYFKLNS